MRAAERWRAVEPCEAGAVTSAGPDPSLRDMRRLGLTERHERRNWVWRA